MIYLFFFDLHKLFLIAHLFFFDLLHICENKN
jgi:hypothetical protein